MWYKNISGRFFGLVTKHACDGQADRQTDGQNYDSQNRASIAALRGKNKHRPIYRTELDTENEHSTKTDTDLCFVKMGRDRRRAT